MSDLLALSDVLVLRALERAYSRGLIGSSRSAIARRNVPRHRAYEAILIPAARHSPALDGAWSVTDELAQAWHLPVAGDAWARSLDAYCRDLLTTQRPRSLTDLEAITTSLVTSRVA